MPEESPNLAKDFFTIVYEIVEQIPFGRVTTYGAIANAIGSKKSSRLVGIAMNHSHEIAPNLPAHRVVNRSGILTGQHHFLGEKSMIKLLTDEGLTIENNSVQQFEHIFWDPLNEL